MSAFDGYMADAAGVIDEFIGRTVVYRVRGLEAAGVDIRAAAGPVSVEERGDDRGREGRRVRRITVLQVSDTPDLSMADTFVVDDEVWAVEAIEQQSATMAMCRCRRTGRIEASRQGLRTA